MNTHVRINTAQILPFPCMVESAWWSPWLCSVLEPISVDLVILGLNPMALAWEESTLLQCEARLLWCWPRCWLCWRHNTKSSCKCKGMEQNALFWWNDSVTCYLGGAIITMLPHILCWPPSWGWGWRVRDRCSKGSTLSKNVQFYFE